MHNGGPNYIKSQRWLIFELDGLIMERPKSVREPPTLCQGLFWERQSDCPTWPEAESRSTAEGCCIGKSSVASGVPGQVEGVKHSSIQLDSVMGVRVPSRLKSG